MAPLRLHPLAALVVPIMGCSRMSREERKLWALDEEIKHCKGWQDVFY